MKRGNLVKHAGVWWVIVIVMSNSNSNLNGTSNSNLNSTSNNILRLIVLKIILFSCIFIVFYVFLLYFHMWHLPGYR